MRDLAEWKGVPWPRLEMVTTGEQYLHAVRNFGTALVSWDWDFPGFWAVRDELRRRGAVFDWEERSSLFLAEMRLRPDLADLWPLPEGMSLSLNGTSPFGGPDSEPEDDCTEEELDRMVAALGPLNMNATWDCGWRGLSDSKGCGVELCLNSVWVNQHAEPAPGEFGVLVSLGSRVAWTPAGQAWVRDLGLSLGEPRIG
ncbi:hypothetical protein ACIPRD_23620 [Streptomyces sp. NPDC090108]|uniref:hypothetical protein n=1 Tax=Streptomyces sp. NPDC090108 TaxID=3365947 RepID=UPI0038074A85